MSEIKKTLLIINPYSGMKRANTRLCDILQAVDDGGDFIVHVTKAPGDGRNTVERLAPEMNRIICVGGDGTFNECADGMLKSGVSVPIGYIPSGSTNDFASSLKISKNILEAANNIVSGSPVPIDCGSFNGRFFTYVASFGAFTKASYSTPQNVKNALGHFAYIIEGMKDMSLRPYHVKMETPDKTVENNYVFGAVSNSTSVAGILTLPQEIVNMSDGKFEILLVKNPKTPIELNECIRALTSKDYSSEMLDFFSSDRIAITAQKDMDWTLDGELQKGSDTISVKNIKHAIKVIL